MALAANAVSSEKAVPATNEKQSVVSLRVLRPEETVKTETSEVIREPSEAELAELAAESQKLESATPREILKWAVDRFA